MDYGVYCREREMLEISRNVTEWMDRLWEGRGEGDGWLKVTRYQQYEYMSSITLEDVASTVQYNKYKYSIFSND